MHCGKTTFKSCIHYSTHAYLDAGRVCDPSTERRVSTLLLNSKVSAPLRQRAGLIWKTPGFYLPVLIGSAGERTKNAGFLLCRFVSQMSEVQHANNKASATLTTAVIILSKDRWFCPTAIITLIKSIAL